MLIVPQSIRGPAAVTIRFRSPVFSVDLSTVTAVDLNVRRRDGSAAVWSAQIISATNDELVAQYVFSDGSAGEITGTGLYYLSPSLTVPGGKVPTDAVSLFVTNDTGATPHTEQSVWVVATVDVLTLGPVKQTWGVVATTPYAAKATQPFLAFDTRTTSITATLWAGLDGDSVVLGDPYRNADSHPVTVIAGAGQALPVGDGSYSGSVTYTKSNFPARLKFDAAASQWFAW